MSFFKNGSQAALAYSSFGHIRNVYAISFTFYFFTFYVSTNGKENGLFSLFERIFNSKASGKNSSTQLFWKRGLKRNCKSTIPGTQDQILSRCILFSENILLTLYYICIKRI